MLALKSAIILFLAFALPVAAQSGPEIATVSYRNGTQILSVTDPASRLEMSAIADGSVSSVMKFGQKFSTYFVLVHFSIRNTSRTVPITFDPYSQMNLRGTVLIHAHRKRVVSDVDITPAPLGRCQDIEKKLLSQADLGNSLLGGLGNFFADLNYSQYSATNTYEHQRADAAVDSSRQTEMDTYKRRLYDILQENTLSPGEKVEGTLYFELPVTLVKPKKNASPIQNPMLSMSILGKSYMFAFAE